MNNFSKAALLATAVLVAPVGAQELSGSFTGDITSAPVHVTQTGATSVTVSFTYDTAVPFTVQNYSWGTGTLVSVNYEFFNAQGEPVNFAFSGPFEYSPNSSSFSTWGQFQIGDEYSFNTMDYTIDGQRYFAYFNLDASEGTLPQLYAPFATFPLFNTFSDIPNGYGSTLIIQAPNSFYYDFIELDVHTLSYGVLDADNDGVVDDADLCAASLTEDYVMFGGWLDSGVSNYVDADGCTIMDHYAACQPEATEEPVRFSRFQPRYSGPSYCEKQVSYELTSDGLIDFTEARMLRDALYMSYRSGDR